MAANYKAELTGCFGRPVAENPTGVMQEAAFRAAGLNWRYLTVEVGPDDLADAFRGVRAFGMRGVNLTIPHKVAVIPLLDDLSKEARMIGAVNTVVRQGDKLIGENTDGKGFLRGVRTDGRMDPAGKRVVMLGAGGAARAIGTELLLAGVSDLVVVNRGFDRGQSMTADLKKNAAGPVRFEHWQGTYVVPNSVDLFVNATSIGLYPDVAAMPDVDLSQAKSDMLVADAVFNPPETRLLAAARRRGLPTLDGLSMLVYQGVIGFQLWTGQDPDEAVMKRALAEALGV
ncbi:MAG: shikimate dehydrogenase [Acidobacteria bacterium]|nr:shikimate dehydrogenase [Acidobacteriota bacterium]